jgi:hypothetical protein
MNSNMVAMTGTSLAPAAPGVKSGLRGAGSEKPDIGQHDDQDAQHPAALAISSS